MFLIHCRLKGRDFPTPLPDALIASARDDYAPPSQTPASIIKDKSRYDINLDEIAPTGTAGFPPHAGSVTAPAPTPDGPVPISSLPRFSSATNLMAHSQQSPASAVTSPLPGATAGGALYLSPAPAVSSAPAVMQPGGGAQFISSPLQALSPSFGSVQLVASSLSPPPPPPFGLQAWLTGWGCCMAALPL
jgi:hypothetical protein